MRVSAAARSTARSTAGWLRRFVREESGLELLEWAILAVILAALVGAYMLLVDSVEGLATTPGSTLTGGS